ncbi:DNA helicase [Methylomonas koyamae]|nr:DNA helicase [Methylomonas koyamae]BBL60175.1 replicative DNA helicase [Methylomonas koyamae]
MRLRFTLPIRAEPMSEDLYFLPDQTVESLKVPPHSIQAEQSVLGGLLLDNQTWDSVADKVGENDFYRRDHRLIFRAIAELAERQDPFDVVTISEVLETTGELQDVGGLAYLSTLARDTPSAANIVAYANIVRDRSVLRQLIHVGTEISDSAFSTEGRETAELLENAERKVFEIAEQRQKGQGGFNSIKSLLAKAVDKIEMLYEQDGDITGASTGFTDLDEKTSGLQPSDLIIVAGRPSMGKTTIAMNMAENVALKSGMPVAVFSMEMPGEALAMRMMSSLGRIDQHKVRTGKLDDDDWPRLTSAINLLAETKMFIDDTPALTPTEVRSRARRLTREHGQLGLIVIDYLQLMQSPASGDNRVQQISDISRGLKALAKELNVPVIALSQLNRNLEQRPNKRPVMSDLRESGAIEQDADLIIFVYRDEVYHEDSPDKGIAEVIIGKQRNGPLGTVRLTFLGQYTRFENFAGIYDGPEDYE